MINLYLKLENYSKKKKLFQITFNKSRLRQPKKSTLRTLDAPIITHQSGGMGRDSVTFE